MLIPGTSYVSFLLIFKKGISFEDWWEQVVLFVFFPVLIVIATRFESPKTTRERNRLIEQQEAEDEAREISYYRSLSEEGKLLYDLNQKQEKTEAYARSIYGAIVGGAVGYLIYYFLF